jgi:Endonuclease/Exonuclease/phosphatase family
MGAKTLSVWAAVSVLVIASACGSDDAAGGSGGVAGTSGASGSAGAGGSGGAGATILRVAQYNIQLLSTLKLTNPTDPQVVAAVDVISRFSPDVISINEMMFDFPNDGSTPTPGSFDGGAENAERLADRLNAKNTGAPYAYTLITLGNAGQPWSGYDATQHDPYFEKAGNATIPGSINIALISRYPILKNEVRVIADFAWADLPEGKYPEMESALGITVPAGHPLFQMALVVAPVDVQGTVVHMVMLHTVPPVGAEANKYRNHDELTGMRLFIEGKLPNQAPLPPGARYVLLGDFNADGDHGDGFPEAIGQLLTHPLLYPFQPEGAGSLGVSPELNTTASVCPAANGPDPSTGSQFQLDYLLPSATIGAPTDGGVFFPDSATTPEDWTLACAVSDHMMVWADLPL